jgi:hypothetical protein
MATLAAKADGNLTGASTWALVDPTSYNPTANSLLALTTAYVASSTFTPGAITIDGIAVFFGSRNASPSGTVTVALDQGGADVAGTIVTINVADIHFANGSTIAGGYFFKFASPVTLLAATAYGVKIKASVSGQLSAWVTSGSNWARYLRTTTAQTVAAGDRLFIGREHTGAGAFTTRTVTMDDASAGATVYGDLDINNGGALSFGTNASTAYHLKLAGTIYIHGGGTLNIGTAGTPMPASSTAVLEFNCSSNVQYGLELREGAICNMRGATKTVKAFLAADAAAGATGLTTDVSTGWKSGDEIGIASTTRTNTECEKRTLSADAVTTTLSVPALTNAHGGVAPVRAELINLTRNVKVRGASASLNSYINIAATAVFDWQYVEFLWLGSGTTNKRGIDVATSTGSGSIQYCSFHDSTSSNAVAVFLNSSVNNNLTVAHNVFYSLASYAVFVSGTTNTTITVDDNVALLNATALALFQVQDVGITFTSNTAVGCGGIGINIIEANVVTGTFSGNYAHSNASNGVSMSNLLGGSMGVSAWRNNGSGISCDGLKNVTLDTPTSFGNNGQGIYFSGGPSINVTIKNPNIYAGTTLAQTQGIVNAGGIVYNLQVEGGSLGSPSTHSAGDLFHGVGAVMVATLHNVLLGSPTEVGAFIGSAAAGSRISSQRHDQTAGNHKSWFREGTIVIDTTIADVSPSERLTPAISSEKLKSGRLRVAVLNGQTVTFTVKVRKSAAGDGTAYNGSQPRLLLEKNVAAGVAADTVLATAAAAAGAWETLTGTTPAAQGNTVFTFFVDCDGTTGWVNVDTAGAS